jgi:multiple sugar transport system permease protein
MDGAGHLRTFVQIYLPNSAGPLAVGFVMLGTGWWGEYIYAALLLPDRLSPLGVKVATGYYDPTVQNLLTPAVLAGSLLFTLPAILAFFALQRKLARGIVTTGLKG